MAKEIYKDNQRTITADGNKIIISNPGKGINSTHYLTGATISTNLRSDIPAALRKMGEDPNKWVTLKVNGFEAAVIPIEAGDRIRDEIKRVADEITVIKNDPANIERAAISKLYADAYRIENSGREDNVNTSMNLRRKASERLKAWREKYPEKAKKEEADKLIAKAEREEELANGALFYDADGWLKPEDQRSRHDQFMTNAKEYRRQAEELLNPTTKTQPAGEPSPAKDAPKPPEPEAKTEEPKASKDPEKPQPKPGTVSLEELKQAHTERNPASQMRDGILKHQVTIEHTNPAARRWLKDPGSMDILGVDSPKSVTKATRQPKPRMPKPPKAKSPASPKNKRVGKYYVSGGAVSRKPIGKRRR